MVTFLLLGFAYSSKSDLAGLSGAVVGYVAGYWLPQRNTRTVVGGERRSDPTVEDLGG